MRDPCSNVQPSCWDRQEFRLHTKIMDKSLKTLAFLGRFPIHTGPTAPLTPQTMLDLCVQNFFRVSTLYGVGGGRTARKFRKGCTFLRENREMTEKYEYCSTIQGLLSRIVGKTKRRLHDRKTEQFKSTTSGNHSYAIPGDHVSFQKCVFISSCLSPQFAFCFFIGVRLYRKISKISPSMYKPLQI